MKTNSRKILLIVLVTGLFLPVFNAQADLFSLTSFTQGAVIELLANTAFFAFSALGTFLSALITALHWVVNLRIYTNVPVIEDSWKIMRDFANMFFIIALVVMAYGTIFNRPGYDFKSLITKFLIAAVLINFSLVIGGAIIDIAQVFNNTFLNAMGDISGQLGQGLEPWQLLGDGDKLEKAESIADASLSIFVTLLFAIFMAFLFLVSISVPLVIALIRIPILWALLIVSPIAWLLSILPATRSVFNKWWDNFLSWNLFLPYYLFFLYFALFFLNNKNQVLASLGQTFVNDQLTGLEGLQSSFTFGLLFFYVLVAIFLIGGAKIAMSAGKFSSAGITSIAGRTRSAAMRYVGATAAGRGLRARGAQLEKEGLPGRFGSVLYGGERGLERQTSFFAEKFGVKGARDVQKIKEIGELKSKFARITDPEALRSLKDKGRMEEKLAIREIMRDRNLLSNNDLLETYKLYGGSQSLAGKQFARSINYEKISPKDRVEWLKNTGNDIESQQKILGVMADKGDTYILKKDGENIRRALDLFALEGEKKDFLNKIQKKDVKLATELQTELGFLKKDGRTLTDINEALEMVVSKLKPDDLLESTKTLTDPKDEELRRAVAGTLNAQKVEAIFSKGTREQVDAWQNLVKEHRSDILLSTKGEQQEKQAQAFGEAVARAMGRSGQGGGQPPPSGGAPSSPPTPSSPSGGAPPNVLDLRKEKEEEK